MAATLAPSLNESGVAQKKQVEDREADPSTAQMDGFHLVLEALKLNGLDTIYGLPGIPITDLTRLAQRA